MSEYGEDIKEKIAILIEKMEQFKGELNREEFREILAKNFALSDKDAIIFMKLMDKMIPHVDYYAIPDQNLFKIFKDSLKGKKSNKTPAQIREEKSKNFKKHAPQIRKEKNEMKETIKAFMAMPVDAQKIIIDDWPTKYHDFLNKIPQKIPDIDHEKYYEENVFEPYQIADIIIGNRYGLAPSTIEKYSRPGKKKKKN